MCRYSYVIFSCKHYDWALDEPCADSEEGPGKRTGHWCPRNPPVLESLSSPAAIRENQHSCPTCREEIYKYRSSKFKAEYRLMELSDLPVHYQDLQRRYLSIPFYIKISGAFDLVCQNVASELFKTDLLVANWERARELATVAGHLVVTDRSAATKRLGEVVTLCDLILENFDALTYHISELEDARSRFCAQTGSSFPDI